jgi:hypothetical protein
MSHVYTPTATKIARQSGGGPALPDNVTDKRDAASVNVPFGQLADGIEFLSPLVRLASFRPIGRLGASVAAGAYTSGVGSSPVTGTDIIYEVYGVEFNTVQAGLNEGYIYHQKLTPNELVDGNTLTSVVMRILGSSHLGASHVGLPTVMPSFTILRTDLVGTTTRNLLSTGVATDPTATSGAYDANHSFTWTADQFNVIDWTQYTYDLYVQQEGGTNALIQTAFMNFLFTHTR